MNPVDELERVLDQDIISRFRNGLDPEDQPQFFTSIPMNPKLYQDYLQNMLKTSRMQVPSKKFMPESLSEKNRSDILTAYEKILDVYSTAQKGFLESFQNIQKVFYAIAFPFS